MKKYILSVLVLCLFSCVKREHKSAGTLLYFDLKGYFEEEANRLQKNTPLVSKQVFSKGETEQKSIKITNWKNELAVFEAADINKASWRGEFDIKQLSNGISYTTGNEKIPVKKLEIFKAGNQITSIKIYKSSENRLYTAIDTLIYYPDSLYMVQSAQKIKLLAPKVYRITGTFSK
ncbi:hypothetical protein [Pedobacter sp.]|uniref:hypothetical protein n=1 Tax=Pedobacter sp. TaxID=1411316 RepID=UPI0031CE5037